MVDVPAGLLSDLPCKLLSRLLLHLQQGAMHLNIECNSPLRLCPLFLSFLKTCRSKHCSGASYLKDKALNYTSVTLLLSLRKNGNWKSRDK